MRVIIIYSKSGFRGHEILSAAFERHAEAVFHLSAWSRRQFRPKASLEAPTPELSVYEF